MGKPKATDLFKNFNNIEAIAGEKTERKEPGTIAQPVAEVKTETPLPAANPVQTQPVQPVQAQFFTENETSTTQPVVEKTSVLSEKAIDAAGVTGAYLAASSIEMLFEFAEKIMFINRFTKEEKQRLMEMDTTGTQTNEADENLNRKFLAITRKREKIKEKIELDEKENEALKMAFAEYARITGKTANPQLILYGTIGKIFISRSMEIFL